MAKQYDVLFRLLLLGDSGVGKTCLLCRFTDNQFHPAHISTIGTGIGSARRRERGNGEPGASGKREKRGGAAPGKREHRDNGEPWHRGNREHQGIGRSGQAQHRGNGIAGSHSTGELRKRGAVAPGNGSTGEPGSRGHRETGATAPGNREAWEQEKPGPPGNGGVPKNWEATGSGKRETEQPAVVGTGERQAREKRGHRKTESNGDAVNRVDFKMKTIEVDGIKVRIQIWDTAGQERYQTITKQYYRRAQGIFLVYDIGSERSYQHIVKWASDVDEYAPDGVQKILIGNKADEEHKRQVPKEQGLQLAREYGMDFYETSACSNLNIKESFTRLTELVLQAHRKELEELRGPPHAPTLARLEEEEQQPMGGEDTPKTCWC
ncbi:ras-related protein Rab-15 isoform X1 [Willisornis vidua]|uniref:small monomeric GTPase n=1 Tax=Willisornis vidua TaxID=1566151 RepID=A0ABQ9D7X5_9PASS|nr:ras-related protein Rab-15 isoform X1 [Willisornis vidua]